MIIVDKKTKIEGVSWNIVILGKKRGWARYIKIF